jgi:hypothetical protein
MFEYSLQKIIAHEARKVSQAGPEVVARRAAAKHFSSELSRPEEPRKQTAQDFH